MRDLYHIIPGLLEEYAAVAICTIVKTSGSTPLKKGNKMIVYDQGKIYGTVGGGALEKQIIEDALKCLQKEECEYFTHHLLKDHHMCCGGTVEVFIDVVKSNYRLVIFGAGHVGHSLARIAALCKDMDIIVVDDRAFMLALLSDEKRIETVCVDNLPLYLQEYTPKKNRDFIVIATYDHMLDKALLEVALQKNFYYVGMIGSQRKVAKAKKYFQQRGIPSDKIQEVDMPIGIDINAHLPVEIAISIMARIIQKKNSQMSEKTRKAYLSKEKVSYEK